MSEDELVSAYVRGGMSRRMLIRRLVAGGMGVAAAVAYAHALNPAAARASNGRPKDLYTGHPIHPHHPIHPDHPEHPPHP
jgi:hypothetical protein